MWRKRVFARFKSKLKRRGLCELTGLQLFVEMRDFKQKSCDNTKKNLFGRWRKGS